MRHYETRHEGLQMQATLSGYSFLLCCVISMLFACGNSPGTDEGDGSSAQLCGCTNETDEVIGGVCVNQDVACNALTPCEYGYVCDGNLQCACEDVTVCGISCSAECDCPVDYVCDTGSNVCRLTPYCLDDSMCSPDMVCRQDSALGFRCAPPEGLQDGEGCAQHSECASGVCAHNECVPACWSNANCPSGLFCEMMGFVVAGCVSSSSCASCTGTNQICDEPQCRESCRTSGDCEDDCLVTLRRPLQGECWQMGMGDCDPNEFMIPGGTTTTFCMLYQHCWSEDDCPTGYNCYSNEELLQSTDRPVSFCGRRLEIGSP